MSATTISFDPTLHATGSIAGAGAASSGTTTGAAAGANAGVVGTTKKPSAFRGFLQAAGHAVGVVLSEIVKYILPMAQVAAVADPAIAPALAAFTTSLQLVQAAVVSAQQRWVSEGSSANTQKLADVLETVEGPIVLLFAQAGLAVDTAYVTNLVNGVVAILNAQPSALPDAGATK